MRRQPLEQQVENSNTAGVADPVRVVDDDQAALDFAGGEGVEQLVDDLAAVAAAAAGARRPALPDRCARAGRGLERGAAGRRAGRAGRRRSRPRPRPPPPGRQPGDQAGQRRGLAEAGRRGEQHEAAGEGRLDHALLQRLAPTRLARGRGGWILVRANDGAAMARGGSKLIFAGPTASRVSGWHATIARHLSTIAAPDPPLEGGCTCRAVRYRIAEPAALRALLPLPLVPARDRRGVRAQRVDRVRARRAAERRAGAGRHPSASGAASGSRAARAAASRSGATTPAPATRQLRPRRHARRSRSAAARLHSSPRASSPGGLPPGSPAVAEYYDRKQHWPAESLAHCPPRLRAKGAREERPSELA